MAVITIANISDVGGGGIEFTDGTNTVNGATKLTVTGGTIGGSSPNATLSISIPAGGTPGATYTNQVNPGSLTTVAVSLVAAGFGVSPGWGITPAASGIVLAMMWGYVSASAVNSEIRLGIAQGTGTAPSQGVSQNQTGMTSPLFMFTGTAADFYGYSLSWIYSGLTVSTHYWFDLVWASPTSTGTLGQANLQLWEMAN